MRDESEFEMVTRHVREGAAILQGQRNLIKRLKASGRGTKRAEELLAIFTDMQEKHRAHLARLQP